MTRNDPRERGYKSIVIHAKENPEQWANILNGLAIAAAEGECRIEDLCWLCDTSEPCRHDVITRPRALDWAAAILVRLAGNE